MFLAGCGFLLQCFVCPIFTGFSKALNRWNPRQQGIFDAGLAFQEGPGFSLKIPPFLGQNLPRRAFFLQKEILNTEMCSKTTVRPTIATEPSLQDDSVKIQKWSGLFFKKVPLMGKKDPPPWSSVVNLELRFWSLEVEQLAWSFSQ